MNKNAICLITHKPSQKEKYLSFLNNFVNYDVFVIIDDNTQNYFYLQQKYPKLYFVAIPNVSCETDGYKNISAITLRKSVTGWDKAIYFFAKKLKKEYQQIWFLEDDVYFHSEKTLLQIDEKYTTENPDILCNCSYDDAKLDEWLWNKIDIPFSPPYHCGMMCIIRLSQKYLRCIEDYVNQYHTLFFLEAFFPTITKKYDLKLVKSPSEFTTVTYIDKVNATNQVNLYHPVKNINDHEKYRYNSINNIPNQRSFLLPTSATPTPIPTPSLKKKRWNLFQFY